MIAYGVCARPGRGKGARKRSSSGRPARTEVCPARRWGCGLSRWPTSEVATWADAAPGTEAPQRLRPNHGLAATPLHRERVAVEQLRLRLRPRRLAGIPGADIAVWHEPAGRSFGIGFYDVFSIKGDVWRLVAGDIAGRGVDTAVLAAFARDAFRTPDAAVRPTRCACSIDWCATSARCGG